MKIMFYLRSAYARYRQKNHCAIGLHRWNRKSTTGALDVFHWANRGGDVIYSTHCKDCGKYHEYATSKGKSNG